MGRAGQFTTPTDRDFALAKEYVVENYEGAKLKLMDGGFVGDEPYTTSYCVYLAAPLPDRKYQVLIHSSQAPAYGYKAMKLILLDAVSSEAFLIDYEALLRVVAHASTQGGLYGGLYVQPHGEWSVVTMERSWMVEAKLAAEPRVLGEGRDSFLAYRSLKSATSEQFCHLHVHSCYSLLDGVALVENIPWQAKLNGQPGIALTDHGNMFAAFKFNAACKEHGIKPVFGVEAYLVDDVNVRYKDNIGQDRRFEHHITLLAMNQQGWENLCELMTISGRDHFYYTNRIDHNLLFKYNEGIFVLSGCFKGMASWYLTEHDPVITAERPWCRFDPDRARQYLTAYHQVFKDRLAVELQAIPNFDRYTNGAVPRLKQMARELGIPTVVTVDCHLEVEEDAVTQALLTRVGGGEGDGVEGKADMIRPFWIKPSTMIQHDCFEPADFTRTCEIMERCNVNVAPKGYLFPRYPTEHDVDWQAYMAWKGQQRA